MEDAGFNIACTKPITTLFPLYSDLSHYAKMPKIYLKERVLVIDIARAIKIDRFTINIHQVYTHIHRQKVKNFRAQSFSLFSWVRVSADRYDKVDACI